MAELTAVEDPRAAGDICGATSTGLAIERICILAPHGPGQTPRYGPEHIPPDHHYMVCRYPHRPTPSP